jgi:hypothetical protein
LRRLRYPLRPPQPLIVISSTCSSTDLQEVAQKERKAAMSKLAEAQRMRALAEKQKEEKDRAEEEKRQRNAELAERKARAAELEKKRRDREEKERKAKELSKVRFLSPSSLPLCMCFVCCETEC